MDDKDQPANLDIALRASFESRCRDLNNRLNISLGLLTERLNHAYQGWNKHNAHFASLANLLLEDIGHASGLLNPLPDTRLTDNTRFIEIIDKLGTPEAKYLARQLRLHKELAHHAVAQGSGPIRTPGRGHPLQAETEEVKAGEEMPFHEPLVALRLLLEKEQELFSDKERRALLDRIDKLEEPEKDCNSIKLKLDAVAKSLDSLYTLAEQLERLLGIFSQLNEDTNRLHKIENGIKRLEDEATTDEYSARALKIDRVQLAMEVKLRGLEGKLTSQEGILAQNEAIIKEHFAVDKRLISAIAAILQDIQFLCGDLVKIKIGEISEWEITLAEQSWGRFKTNLPEKCALSGIQPDLIDEAFAFLKEHGNFLVAYNMVMKAPDTISGIESGILATQGHIIDRKKDARAMGNERVAERKHHNTRLERTAEETIDEIDQLTAELFEELEKLRTGAGITDPLEKMEPGKFWTEIEKGFGCGALIDAEKTLDAIEPTIHKLNLKSL